MIENNYAQICFLYYLLIYHGVFVKYIQHPMLDLIKGISITSTRDRNTNGATTMFSFMVTSKSSVITVYNDVIANN